MLPSKFRHRHNRVALYALTFLYLASLAFDEPRAGATYAAVPLLGLAVSAAFSFVGNAIQAHEINQRNKNNPIDRGRNNDLRLQTSEYGAAIPRIYGRARFAGNIIDGRDIEVQTSTTRGARVKKVRQPDTINYVYACLFYVLLCEGPISDVLRIWMDAELIYSKNATGTGGGGSGGGRDVTGVIDLGEPYPADEDDPSDFYHQTATDDGDSIAGDFANGTWRVWRGTATQAQDPSIVAIHGASLTPAYRHRCYAGVYVLVKDGRVPTFTFEIDEGTTDAGETVVSLYSLNGVTAGELDVTALSSDEQDGLLIGSRQQLKQPLEDLSVYHKFDPVDVDGKLKMVKRSGASVVTIPATDLRAHEEDEETPEADGIVEDPEELTLPQQIEVGYIDASPGADYHHNVQLAPRFIGNSQDQTNINLPIVMTPDKAKQLGEYLLARAHTEARTVSFQTGWKYLFLHPNDVVTVELDGVTLVVRITQMNASLPTGVIKFQGVVQESTILSQSATSSAGSGLEAPVIQFPGNQRLVLLESPPIHDIENKLLVTCGTCLRGDGTFRGAFLYRANPAGAYDDLVATFPEQSTTGVTASTLANAGAQNFDETSTLTGNFYQGSFSSCTQGELLADPYKNLLAVKNSAGDVEYVQFTTATPGTATFPYTARYTFSGFLRGRFGTDAAAASHATDCDVLLMDATVQTIEFEPTDVGRTLSMKSVSAGQQLADAPVVSLTLTGRSLSPSAPVNLTGTRNSDNDLLIEAQRRGRHASILRGFNSPPISEEREEYAADIFTAGGAALKRTIPIVPPYQTEAVLESDYSNSKYDQISGNTASGTGTFAPVTTVQYGSLQRITRPGNFADATLTATATATDTTGHASLCLLDAATEWRKKIVTPFLEVRITEGSPVTTVIYVNGVSVYSATTHANGTRWTLEMSGSSVKVYADYKGRASVPVYETAIAPAYPLRVFGQVRKAGSSAADVTMTTTPELKAVYTAAQQVADGFVPGNLIYVRLRQVSAVLGYGQNCTATI